MNLKHLFLLFLLILPFQGCSFGPDYKRPELPLPPGWRTAIDDPQVESVLHWWENLGDPELNNLVCTALDGNHDLKIAVSRINQFYARYGVSRTQLFPDVNGRLSAERRQNSGLSNPVFSDPSLRNYFQADVNLAWEIDLWGRIRRLNEAALADFLSQEASRRGVILTLISSVAKAYVELRMLDAQLAISKDDLTNRVQSYQFAKARFDAGVVSELDVVQAQAEVEATRANIPNLEKLIGQKENQLSILLGRPPGEIKRGLSLSELATHSKVPPGVSSASLLQRPDVLAAEQQLISANAAIGSRIAEFFPRLSLTGLFGYQTTEFEDLFDSGGRTWNVSPWVNIPFRYGTLAYQLDVAEAIKEEQFFNYERTLLNAFREVEDALLAYKKAREEGQARHDSVAVLNKYVSLATSRYDEGQTNYLEVLDAQRSLYRARLELAGNDGARVASAIEIFRALGGPWLLETDPALNMAEEDAEETADENVSEVSTNVPIGGGTETTPVATDAPPPELPTQTASEAPESEKPN